MPTGSDGFWYNSVSGELSPYQAFANAFMRQKKYELDLVIRHDEVIDRYECDGKTVFVFNSHTGPIFIDGARPQ